MLAHSGCRPSIPLSMSSAAIIATARVHPGSEAAFAAWQARHSVLLSEVPGFTSCDVIPPPSNRSGDPWTLILHFESDTAATAWQHSPMRGRLIGEVAPLLDGGNLGETLSTGSAHRPAGEVTEVVFSRVKPGMEERYREWASRIQIAQAQYPGYRGMYLQPPARESNENRWTSIFRYETAANLAAWMNSPERRALVAEAREFVESEELMRLNSAFPGWLPLDPSTGESPPNWKAAMLVLLGLFPIVMLEMKYLNLARFGIETSLAVFIGNSISVALTSFLTMPLFVKWFGWWLCPEGDTFRANARGIGIICLLFVAEVILLWNLLP